MKKLNVLRQNLLLKEEKCTKALMQTWTSTVVLYMKCLVFHTSFTPHSLQLQELQAGAHTELRKSKTQVKLSVLHILQLRSLTTILLWWKDKHSTKRSTPHPPSQTVPLPLRSKGKPILRLGNYLAKSDTLMPKTAQCVRFFKTPCAKARCVYFCTTCIKFLVLFSFFVQIVLTTTLKIIYNQIV